MNEGRKVRTVCRGWLLVPVIAAALAALYALAGFLLVPWIAERELPRFADERLQHRARVGAISFNPFTLRLQLREFALETKEGRPVLGFAEGVADLGWHSLLRRAWMSSRLVLASCKAASVFSKSSMASSSRSSNVTRCFLREAMSF